MCCGQNRAAVTREFKEQTTRSSDSTVRPAPTVHESPRSRGLSGPPAGWSSLRLRYLERSPIRVQGPATGRAYDFSAANPIRLVDAQDAESLLRTRFFAKSD